MSVERKVPSAKTPPTVEQGPLPVTPPAAGAAPATQDSPDGHQGFVHSVGTGDQESGRLPPSLAPPTYRLWVNMKGTILVRMWDSGNVEVARRDATWETWGPPETLFEDGKT